MKKEYNTYKEIMTQVERGVEPPIWLAANVPGGDGVVANYIQEYRHRIKHL